MFSSLNQYLDQDLKCYLLLSGSWARLHDENIGLMENAHFRHGGAAPAL